MATGSSYYIEENNDKYVLCETKPFQEARERTFLRYPFELNPCRMKMKEAGWFIVRHDNGQLVTVCLYCKKVCRGWTRYYDPLKVHQFLSPECVFVQFAHRVQTPSSPIVQSISRRQQVRPSTHPMAVIYTRKESFRQWPLGYNHPSFDELAECGLFYTGQHRIVECFYCHGQRLITRRDDNLMLAHTNRCEYAKSILRQPLQTPLDIHPSNKSYRYEINEVNDTSFYYLQSINSTTPGILLAAKTILSDEQTSETLSTILKRLQPIDRQNHKINWMTSSDGPLVNILKELAANPIHLTDNIQYLTNDDLSSSSTNIVSNSSSQCRTCLNKNASPHGVPIRCGHTGLCLDQCFPKWSTCVICGYTLGRSLRVFHV